MQSLEQSQLLKEYYLIDWSRSPGKEMRKKVITMTVYEAWVANQGFGLNGITLRYIKQQTEI